MTPLTHHWMTTPYLLSLHPDGSATVRRFLFDLATIGRELVGACWGALGWAPLELWIKWRGMNQENPKFIKNIYPSPLNDFMPSSSLLATTMKFHARATSWWIMPCCANNLQKGYIRLDDKIGYCIRQLLVGVVIDHQSRSVTKKPRAPYTFCFTKQFGFLHIDQ